jgi:hypothetical protein
LYIFWGKFYMSGCVGALFGAKERRFLAGLGRVVKLSGGMSSAGRGWA